MLSREQYENVISSFFVELNHLIKDSTENELRELPGFSKEIDEYMTDVRDPSNSPSNVLYNSFAFVDEYAFAANKDQVLAAGYEAYKILHNRGQL
jgi:hypothetical protein